MFLNESENACNAISRILRYGAPNIMGEQDAAEFSTGGGGEFPGSEGGGTEAGGGEEVEVTASAEEEV